jgi:hypothetical protein
MAGKKLQIEPFFEHLSAISALDEVRQIKVEKLKH